MVKKRCRYCGKVFIADKRVGDRQKACSPQCQKQRKKDNNRAFRRDNPEYWRGRYDVIKEWRLRNPGYQRNWRLRKKQERIQMKPGEIQAELFTKALDTVEKNVSLLRKIQAEILVQILDAVARKAISRIRTG
jgi:hypothetical protein